MLVMQFIGFAFSVLKRFVFGNVIWGLLIVLLGSLYPFWFD